MRLQKSISVGTFTVCNRNYSMRIQITFMLVVAMGITIAASAQKATWRDTSKITIPEFRKNLNASGSHYLKATLVTQAWARYSEFNPGSTIDGTAKSSYTDFGIRRWRIQAFGQVTDRIFFYMQFGQNNLSILTPRHTGAFLHDAIAEYKVMPQLQLGMGLTGWTGMSRFTSPAVGSILGMEPPLYQQATNGINDQFVRKLSAYAKGQISRFDYRIALSSPFVTSNSTVKVPAISTNSSFSLEPPQLQTSGYLMWQFLDKENNAVPYMTGTYLGKKKVLNIGAGWVHQSDAVWHLSDDLNDTVRTQLLLLGADVFADLPVNKKGAAITAYVAYNHFDFGKNYIRMNGGMNPSNGVGTVASLNGPGVNFPMIGTGNILFTQVGYKFRDKLLADNGTLQPYVIMQYSRFQLLDEAAIMVEGGMNWLIHGTHTGKITLGFQNRPVFETNAVGENVQASRKNMVVLQYQISL